jgi:fatty acid hydroxylase domain-containing protein 2
VCICLTDQHISTRSYLLPASLDRHSPIIVVAIIVIFNLVKIMQSAVKLPLTILYRLAFLSSTAWLFYNIVYPLAADNVVPTIKSHTDAFLDRFASPAHSEWLKGVMTAEFHMTVSFTFIVHQITFYFWCGLLTFLDLFEWPQIVFRYKIQPKVHVGWAGHWKCFKRVLFNQVVILLPSMVVGHFIFSRFTQTRFDAASIPTVGSLQIFKELVVYSISTEIVFYYSHRSLHWKPLYGRIHKIHHEFKAPIGAACEYAHWIEMLFGNILSVMSGPALCASHITHIWWFTCIAMMSTINGHSGYSFPWAPFRASDFHDYHHEFFNTAYGTFGWLDRLHGTDADFRKHQAKVKKELASKKTE